MKEFNMAGMNGGVASMDDARIVIEKCSHILNQNHLGGKSQLICRAFNITTNHRRRILYTTSDHPARWNNTTIVFFNKFAKELKNSEILQDSTFTLFQHENT